MPDSERLRKIRQKVIDRDGTVCCYCGEFLLTQDITMDHIVPISKRGTFNTTNLTVSCKNCNNTRKSTPFFQFCSNFNWSESKIQKYRNLYNANLKIKILNIAKENCINDIYNVVPNVIIKEACNILKILPLDFSKYLSEFQIDGSSPYKRKQIKFVFEEIIKIIEKEVM